MTVRRLVPVACAILLGLPASGAAQTHPSQLPALGPDTVFPRCTEGQLAVACFPDHLHRQHWTTWMTPVDDEGRPYGPGSLCDGTSPRDTAGLVMAPGEKRYGQFVLRHDPRYADCDMIPLLELLDWANHEVPAILGLAAPGTLTVLNPDNTADYREKAGQGVWRLYRLDGDEAIIEPYPVLLARTLDGHGAFMLVTDWILQQALPVALPPWLRQGLVEYIGEDGTHLVNYMGEFREKGPVLFSAPLVDAILAKGVDPDEGADRENFRRACYSAYLMVWQLVEFEGGLAPLQDFLARAAAGEDLDDAARGAWGMDLAALADLVDAGRNGEPVGGKMRRQTPHVQP